MSLSLVVCPPWLRTKGKIIGRPWASHFLFSSLYFRMCKTGRIGRPRLGQASRRASLVCTSGLGVGVGGGRPLADCFLE